MQSEEDKQDTTEHRKKSDDFSNNSQKASIPPGMLHCPECGSSLIRKPIGPTLVIYNVILFVSIFLLWALSFHLQLGHVSRVLLIIFVLSAFTFFVAVFIAFTGKHFCLSCGNDFRSMVKTKRGWMWWVDISFPWQFVILNTVLLVLIYILSRSMFAIFYYASFSIIIIETIVTLISPAFWAFWSFWYQVFIFEIFKKRIKNNLLWAIIFILPAIILGANRLYNSLPTVNARRILNLAELAPLPKSAKEIKFYTWSSLFSGEKFLRFRASPRDIEKFIKESPILQDAECEIFSAERMRVKYPKDSKKRGQIYNTGHETFIPDPSAPNWYKGEIKKGRLYIINPEWGYYPGEVIVDDEQHFVYINIIWS